MKEADYIKAINDKAPELKVTEDLLVVQLKAIHDGLEAQDKLEQTETELESLKEAYQELAEENSNAAARTVGGRKAHTVKVGKKTYRTTGRAISISENGSATSVSAEDLVKDKKLCEKLVESGSGFLIEVETSKS